MRIGLLIALLWVAAAAVQAQVLQTPTVSVVGAGEELPAATVQPASPTDVADAPPPGKRFIVSMEPTSTRSRARRGNKLVRDTLTLSGGSVVLESDNTDNPFVVFEADTPEQAAGIAQAASRAKGEHRHCWVCVQCCAVGGVARAAPAAAAAAQGLFS